MRVPLCTSSALVSFFPVSDTCTRLVYNNIVGIGFDVARNFFKRKKRKREKNKFEIKQTNEKKKENTNKPICDMPTWNATFPYPWMPMTTGSRLVCWDCWLGWVDLFCCFLKKGTEYFVFNGFGYLSAESVQAGQNKNQLETKLEKKKKKTQFFKVAVVSPKHDTHPTGRHTLSNENITIELLLLFFCVCVCNPFWEPNKGKNSEDSDDITPLKIR